MNYIKGKIRNIIYENEKISYLETLDSFAIQLKINKRSQSYFVNNMTISIITVCYNSSKTLSRTIESVLNQKGVHLEYLIIATKQHICEEVKTIIIVSSVAQTKRCFKETLHPFI